MQRYAIILLLLFALPACAPRVANNGVANNGVADFCNTAFEADTELGEDEFYTGVFDTWDEDDDGLLNADEWGAGVDLFDDWDGDFDAWDDDDDGLLDEEEFSAGIGETDVFDTWDDDDDGFIDDEECGVA